MLAVFVLGVTCAGKGTFLDFLKDRNSDGQFGFVEVGKEFRKRYPPSYFQGQGAPAHTEKEALEIYVDQLKAAVLQGSEIIFIDGQPRNRGQIDFIINSIAGMKRLYILLHAKPDLLKQRAWAKHREEYTPGNFELRLKRIETDRIALFDVIVGLSGLVEGRNYNTDTENLHILHQQILTDILNYLGY